ncbi:MAG: hypothetical protein SFY80_01210 [Verrucomicrobiota bacterium]|nr:hypothetical protein [Verrucomicrobiota bacterium]
MSYTWQLFLLFALDSLMLSGLQAADALVRVRSIRFDTIPENNGRGHWFETAVEVVAERNPSPEAYNPDFVDSVGVNVGLATQSANGAENRLKFYRSTVTLATLEQGRSVFVRFYLPPEIVKRDKVRGEPAAVMVELMVNGMPLEVHTENTTGLITNADRLDVFRKRLAEEAAPNDGILLPFHRSPFYARGHDSSEMDDPAVIIQSRD